MRLPLMLEPQTKQQRPKYHKPTLQPPRQDSRFSCPSIMQRRGLGRPRPSSAPSAPTLIVVANLKLMDSPLSPPSKAQQRPAIGQQFGTRLHYFSFQNGLVLHPVTSSRLMSNMLTVSVSARTSLCRSRYRRLTGPLVSWDAWAQGAVDKTDSSDLAWQSTATPKAYMMPVSPWFYTNLPQYKKNWVWRGDDMWHNRWQQVLKVQPQFVEVSTPESHTASSPA